MRAVLAHGPGADQRELRHWLLGAGLDCESADIVPWDTLSTRLGQQDADLVVALMDGAQEQDWRSVEQGKSLTAAPLVVVAKAQESPLLERARRAGAARIVPPQQVREGLDEIAANMAQATQSQRGAVISVFAPTPGSGATTVAANLAFALHERHPGSVGLVELAREIGDLALLMDMRPETTAEQVCQRWRVLDRISLRHSFQKHRSGMWVLVNSPDSGENPHLTVESARRLAVLVRTTTQFAVLALDNRTGPCELEAMRLSDIVALVVRPDIPAVRRAHWAMLQAVAAGVPRERFRLVLNRHGMKGGLRQGEIEEALQLKATARIPESPRPIHRAANRGELLGETGGGWRLVTRRFRSLAGTLVRRLAQEV